MIIKWREIIKAVELELENYKQQGYNKPTLRSMFYRLSSARELIPNTKSSYIQLTQNTVRARMDGRLPIDCFHDEVRTVIEDFDDEFYMPESWIDYHVNKLKEIPEQYQNLIPRWHGQPNYVEYWIEKKAMIGTLQPLLKDKQVRIVPFAGYSSLTFLQETATRLREKFNEGKKIHIFYFGDFDPTGDHMPTDLKERLGSGNTVQGYHHKNGLGVWQLIERFTRVAITFEQREKYNLPEKFDPDTEDKLKRDSRGQAFLKKYGRFYQNEIDSLPALRPVEFRDMVNGPIDELFDEEIYQQVLDEFSVHSIRKILKTRVKFLS